MAHRSMFYHAESAPEGREFDLEKTSIEQLKDSGWVDHPYKINYDPWSTDGKRGDECNRVYNAFKNGEIEAIGDYELEHTPSELETMRMKEIAQLHAQLKVQEDINETLKRQLRESKEKDLDEHSDAAKILEKSVGEAAAQRADRKRAAAKRAKPKPAPEPELVDDNLDLESV